MSIKGHDFTITFHIETDLDEDALVEMLNRDPMADPQADLYNRKLENAIMRRIGDVLSNRAGEAIEICNTIEE